MSRPPDQRAGPRPIIGISMNVDETETRVRRTYAASVLRAGGAAVLLPPPEQAGGTGDPEVAALAADVLARLDGLILTGGDDPRTEPYGEPTHHAAKPVHPDRQVWEDALVRAALAADRPAPMPTLGVCLGMQMMVLAEGGKLDQHLPDTLASAADHADHRVHRVAPPGGPGLDPPSRAPLPAGNVHSRHHQAVRDAGALRVVSLAHDGVIEAVDHPGRPFWLGVQWHPERTDEHALGQALFDALVAAAQAGARGPAAVG